MILFLLGYEIVGKDLVGVGEDLVVSMLMRGPLSRSAAFRSLRRSTKPVSARQVHRDRSVQGRVWSGGSQLQRGAPRRDERRRGGALERDCLACLPPVQGKGAVPTNRPVIPGDPYVPPNPIKQFQPTP